MDDFTGGRCPLRPTPGWCFGTERTHGLFSDVGILGILQNQGSNCWGGYESYPPIILKYLNRAFKMHSSTWKTSFNEKKPRLSFGVLNVNPLWPAPGWCNPSPGASSTVPSGARSFGPGPLFNQILPLLMSTWAVNRWAWFFGNQI